jgi:hypothetical protein
VTPVELSSQVRAAFAPAALHLAELAGGPEAAIGDILARPDVDAVLQQALDQGSELAQGAVREAWGSAPHAEYLDWLLADVARSYDSLGLLRAVVRVAWNGALPAERASSVKRAVLVHGSATALRNRLSVEVAATSAQTHSEIAAGEQLEAAGAAAWKQWRCRKDPPDERTCHWCRVLHLMVIPVGADFPQGDPADLTGHGRLTQPPRWYRGWLKGPPRHPRCRCRIVIITSLPVLPVASEGSQAEPEPSYLAASDIRAMPESKFQALTHFLGAAVHELGQMLGRLRNLVKHR